LARASCSIEFLLEAGDVILGDRRHPGCAGHPRLALEVRDDGLDERLCEAGPEAMISRAAS
jgi:hypothetical protein